MLMKKALFTFFILVSIITNAQDFEYKVLFEGIGDNREFTSFYGISQTILASRAAFELGVNIDNHRIRTGVNSLFEFGTDINTIKPKLSLYYQYVSDTVEFMFGALPRRDNIIFPLAMLSDTVSYFRPNIEGLYGKIKWDWGYQNAFIDWVSKKTNEDCEQFMAGSSGEIFYKNLFFQNYLIMFHNVSEVYNNPTFQVEDYAGGAFQLGVRSDKNSLIESDIKAGVLMSGYRVRYSQAGYDFGISLFAELNLRYKKYGFKSVLSSGNGHVFAFGDTYYAANNYMRNDIIWYFINHKKIKGRFNYSFHIVDWEHIDQQQQLSIIYVIGQE